MALTGTRPTLDAQDMAIIRGRAALLGRHSYPDCGDFVEFADGITRRVSHVYGPDWGELAGCQTSDGGSFYLERGFVSFSGSLYRVVPMTSLTLTTERRLGTCWIFHHDHPAAHNGVDVNVLFRVWRCSQNAPR